MNDTLGGIVINLNVYGATVRLDGGELASAGPPEVEKHRDRYERSLSDRKRMAFEVRRDGRRCSVSLAPQIRDDDLEERIAGYLKSTEEWEPPDEMPAAERHFLKKKKRAELFAARRH